MNVYIFSYPIYNFKILLKSSHNIESGLSHNTDKSAIFNPFDLVRFQGMLQKSDSKQESHGTVRTQLEQPIFLPD